MKIISAYTRHLIFVIYLCALQSKDISSLKKYFWTEISLPTSLLINESTLESNLRKRNVSETDVKFIYANNHKTKFSNFSHVNCIKLWKYVG